VQRGAIFILEAVVGEDQLDAQLAVDGVTLDHFFLYLSLRLAASAVRCQNAMSCAVSPA
jgi:hypothetical protein